MSRKGKKMQTAAVKTKDPIDQLRVRVSERERAGLTTATAERLVQAGEGGHEHTQTNVQRITEAPLDRLHKQGFLSLSEWDAGDRYRADAYLAAINPSTGSINWDMAGGGGFSSKVPSVFGSQVVYDARRRWRFTESRLSGAIRTVAHLALVRESNLAEIGQVVFGYADRKDAAVAGRVATRMVCAALVDVYRL